MVLLLNFLDNWLLEGLGLEEGLALMERDWSPYRGTKVHRLVTQVVVQSIEERRL